MTMHKNSGLLITCFIVIRFTVTFILPTHNHCYRLKNLILEYTGKMQIIHHIFGHKTPLQFNVLFLRLITKEFVKGNVSP